MSILNNDRSGKLNGLRVAIVATEGFEQVELTRPKEALEEAGAKVDVISPKAGIKSGKIKGWNMTDWGDSVKVDVELGDAKEGNYDALLLPGGVMNPDKLRMDPQAVSFVKSFFNANKPVAAICHGPWTLIERMWCAERRLPPGLRCRPIFATRAQNGSIRRWSRTAALLPAANRTIFQPSINR